MICLDVMSMAWYVICHSMPNHVVAWDVMVWYVMTSHVISSHLILDFMKTLKKRSLITSRYQPAARLDLSCVSENEGFSNSANTHFGRVAMAVAEEFNK